MLINIFKYLDLYECDQSSHWAVASMVYMYILFYFIVNTKDNISLVIQI